MMPVVLWTDALIYLLVLSIGLLLYKQPADGQVRDALRRLSRNPMAVATGMVLLVFTTIALLDSLHYRPLLQQEAHAQSQYSVEVLSVWDVILQPLRAHNEKSYSAPLSQHLYVKENVTLPNGSVVRDYPRLEIAQGAQPSVAKLIMRGALWGAGICMLVWLVLGIIWARGMRRVWSELWYADNDTTRRTVLWVSALLILVVTVMASLSTHYHVLGTDKIGQDVLYNTLKSIRTGLLIGTLTTLIMLPFAILLGISAGYFGGWLDDVIQYIYTTLNAIPSVLLIAAAVLLMQVYIESHAALFDSSAARTDFRLLFLCVILGVTSWTGLCRLLRGETLKLRELDYVQAARAFGVSDIRIMLRHILPNLYHLVLISVVMDFSGLVLAEAVLSYVGVGVDPAMQSWGNMINAARLEMAREPVVWWPLVAAFGFMFTLVLSANLFADSVRDAFDPKGPH
ncbi:ABC transporter permease [Sulfuriferula nivalis]|uniref:Peptide ABC transporter permease n=1 Tax=Sulfuriferula nivalis TaxID=2675298 RepID=A0A809RHD2_9PROT|nr:ABC transporter permease [Sulfuriferula nivalis]BBP01036.1 peptide ABC transporter permease [Sulfuriferula nivalis]